MATAGGFQDDESWKLADEFESMSIVEHTPDCWADAAINVLHKDRVSQKTLENVLPPRLQFMVQKQQAVIQKIAKEHGFCFDLEKSKDILTVKNVDACTKEELNENVTELIKHITSTVSCTVEHKAFIFEDNIWPHIQRDFYEKSKSAFEDGNIQVFKKGNNNYLLVGSTNIFEKQETILLGIRRQYLATRIENKEMFEVLNMGKILKSNFTKVKVSVQDGQLLFNGERDDIKKCLKYYKEITGNIRNAKRVVSANVHEFLKTEKVRPKINSCLLENGFHVYWEVKKEDKTCYLICRSISGNPEKEADFLTNCFVKEIEVTEEYLQSGQIGSKIESMENAKLFYSGSGLKTVVYYSNIDELKKDEAKIVQQRFWFSETIEKPEVMELLSKSDVRKFINTEVGIKSDIWKVNKERGQIIVYCQSLVEVDPLISSIMCKVCCVSRPAEICCIDAQVEQFIRRHSEFVKIKQDESYWKIYITVNLKDELERLVDAQSKKNPEEGAEGFERCCENSTEKVNLCFRPEIKEYLTTKCSHEMAKIQNDFNVFISFKKTNLELKAESKHNILHAKLAIFQLLESISYQKDVVRINKEWTYENVKKEVEKLERKNSCIVTLEKKKDEEADYLECWVDKNIHIVAAEGSLEDTMCDVLICFLDENYQPVDRSAKQIFMRGGWTELEDAVKSSKEVGKPRILRTSKCTVHSSRATGFLKCEQLLFVSSENLKRDIKEMWNKILENANKKLWHSICIPLDSSLMSSFAELVSILDIGVSEKLESYLELQFCLWDRKDQSRGKTLDICHQYLSSKVYYPIHFLDDKTEKMQTRRNGWQSIEVKLEKGKLLEVAEAKKVDVIVNSTNPELDLSQGFVSSIIWKKGGQGIGDELISRYKEGIEFGDIAISSGHDLGFQEIFHCALYNRWISTGNLSLKVLNCLINKCLLTMEKKGFHTIAFPALGTGKLGYPYISVAKTIMECVTDFGKQHPETCIQTVYIVVHDQNIHCVQVFEDVFESADITTQYTIADMISKPTINFLEYRIPERILLIQLLPEEMYEQVDAVIEISSKDSTTGDVDFRWCSKMGCYHTVMSVTKEHLQTIVDQCFKMLDSKRITSVAVNLEDLMKDSEMNTTMIEAFMKILTKKINKHSPGLTLRKLQFLLCKKEYEKMEHALMDQKQYSWIWNFMKKDSSSTWRKKTVRRQRDVSVSICGPSSDHVRRALNEFRESATSVTGNWCVQRDNCNWAFVSSIINTKLNQAVEQGLKNVEIKEEDGIYDYNFANRKRYPVQGKEDIRPENIKCIQYHNEENKPMPTWTMLWYVLQENKWMLLPEETCRMLTDVGHVEKVSDEQHVYYLKNFKRASKGKEETMEEIISVKARADDKASGETNTSKEMQLSRKSINKTDEEKEENLKIFEFVTGKITYPDMGNETQKIKEKKKLETLGCQVTSITDWTFCIKGSFSQIARVNEMMTSNEKIDSVESQTFANLKSIPMSERDYKVFCHFGNDCQWLKKIGNKLHHSDYRLIWEIPSDEGEIVNEEIEKLYNKVKMMVSDYAEITENKDCSISETIKDVQDKYTNVCLIVNDKDIELISDNYEDLLIVKTLLKLKMSGKKTNRTKRTFVKTESPEHSGESQSSNDDYRRPVSAENKFNKTTQRLKELEVKTTEGLMIKIYAGSITRLNVDCIVNAANDKLMHGGGVALAISEAAGYQFNRESMKYVEEHGPIPVGKCCVTSAGKLSYKWVIHTVGPRWGDYSDKYQCLKDLQDSVEVTFKVADKRGMASIAIPAISSGIFAVPKDLCVEQYYKAAMSFSRNYPFKSLQEIHFVDKDESMVKAIQEIFQLKEPSASNTEKTGNLDKKNDTPAFGAENRIHSTMPPSNAFTVVDVSKNLRIKIHLGNISDTVADAIICPQDEYCHSYDVIAKDIFRDIPDEKPVSKKMKVGDIFLQQLQGNSQWKMIIHAVTPVYDTEHAKDSRTFGKTLETMIQIIMKTADEAKVESISIPLLGTGIGEYKTPVDICASSFTKAVMAYKSELMFLKDIYLVLKDKEDEEMYLELFKYKYEITNRTLVDSGNSVNLANTVEDMPKGENCCICMDTPTKPKTLHKCGHIFCEDCIEQSFKYKPACPNCGTIYGKVTGDQPPGSISIRKSSTRLQGFNDTSGTIVLTYVFNDGKQGPEHPDFGKVYKGISRSGYVPNNKKGRLVAKLLNVAFSRRLVFTIGRSRTTGHDGVITWNDIHHKTRTDGGPARFGYPDPSYLDRVLEELGAKGVNEESADDPEEYKEYSRQIGYLF